MAGANRQLGKISGSGKVKKNQALDQPGSRFAALNPHRPVLES